MLYEITVLRFAVDQARIVEQALDATVRTDEAKGRVLGCWTSDIGQLNEAYVLRAFADEAALATARRDRLSDTNPLGCGKSIVNLRFESYAPFPFLPPVQRGEYGAVYEFRNYHLKHGGLEPTMAAWEAALPQRCALSPLIIAMYALDGPSRFLHIWPFANLSARADVKTESVRLGIWPPRDATPWLGDNRCSTLAVPTAHSPLR